MYQQLGQHHVSSKSECQHGFKSLVLFKHEGQPLLTPRVDDIFLPCSPVKKFLFFCCFLFLRHAASDYDFNDLHWAETPGDGSPSFCSAEWQEEVRRLVAGTECDVTHLAQEHHLLECRLGGCLRGRINIGSNVQLYSCNMYMVWWIFVCHSQHSSSGLDRHFSRQYRARVRACIHVCDHIYLWAFEKESTTFCHDDWCQMLFTGHVHRRNDRDLKYVPESQVINLCVCMCV